MTHPWAHFEAKLNTSNQRISKLDLQLASEDAKIAAKAAQVDRLEGRGKIVEEGTSLISATIRKHCSQVHTTEATRTSTEDALLSYQLN